MAHQCLDCGAACYCDGEDTWFEEAPEDCTHYQKSICESYEEGDVDYEDDCE